MAGPSSVPPVLSCLLHVILLARTPIAKKISPPENTFCLFATGDLIFEECITKLAPSAKLGGMGALRENGVHIHDTNDDTIRLQRVFGAYYYISNNERAQIEKEAYNRMILSDVEIKIDIDEDDCDLLDCMCMDTGLLPHAFPLSIYVQFPRDLSVKTYIDRLTQIGVPSDYVNWLAKLPTFDKDAPTPDYIRPSWFVPPSIPNAGLVRASDFGFSNHLDRLTQMDVPSDYIARLARQTDIDASIRWPPQFVPLPIHYADLASSASAADPDPQFEDYPIPSGKLCVFVTDNLVFEEVMNKTVSSAATIGAGMLWSTYIALGGQTASSRSNLYKGFDRVWGVAYTVDQHELEKLKEYGVGHSFYIGRFQTIVKERYQTNCATFEIGLVPSGFPFNVYGQTCKYDLQHYLKRLTYVGVPSSYVRAIQDLADLLNNGPRVIGY